MSDRHRIAIVGCGIAGAALAIHLGRRGHQVEVFERRAREMGGGGLLLAPAALEHVRALGLDGEMRASGTFVRMLHSTRADGTVLLHWDARRSGQDHLGLAVQRRALHEALAREAAQVATLHFELGILDAKATEGRITDECGHQHGPFDLVVASDGAASGLRATRPALLRRAQRYQWTALCCLMRRARGNGEVAAMRQWFDGANHLSVWPVGPTDDAEERVCVAVNVPPGSLPRFAATDTGLAELRRLGLASGLDALQPTGPWIALACRHVEMRRCFDGGLVFLGDAAHALSPQLGQGTRFALAGAQCLAEAIERHATLPEALHEYDHRQRALVRGCQRASRVITPIFQSPGRGARWLRDRVMPAFARLGAVERAATRRLWGDARPACQGWPRPVVPSSDPVMPTVGNPP